MATLRGRSIGGRPWNLWRALIGCFYLTAAVSNAAYTLPRADDPEPLDGYADGAWFPFLDVHRGIWVDVGVVASLGWFVVVMPFLAWPYLLVNAVLLIMPGVLLLRSYETSLWTSISGRLRRHPSLPHLPGAAT